MSYNAAIGAKIKELRTEKNYTLDKLSKESGLSIGFLSQMERGMSAVAVDTLAKLAEILEIDLNVFFKENIISNNNPVIRSYDKEYSIINEQIIQYNLSKSIDQFSLLPNLFELLPSNSTDTSDLGTYHHGGDEFIYVLEGILTVYYDGKDYLLYPGDSIIIHSTTNHNWINLSNRIVRFISVNTPNPYHKE